VASEDSREKLSPVWGLQWAIVLSLIWNAPTGHQIWAFVSQGVALCYQGFSLQANGSNNSAGFSQLFLSLAVSSPFPVIPTIPA
jgi:hypothetical protein